MGMSEGQRARIGILGASGRMGRALAEALADAPGLALAGLGGRSDDLAALAAESDVLIDFTAPAALAGHIAVAEVAGCALLVGTTGLTAAHHAALDAAAARIAVLQAANTSLGVNLLLAMVRQAAAALGPEWDIEIAELHHRMKVDAPSGTALALGTAAAEGRGIDLADAAVRGRDGMTGPRQPGSIGFAAMRGGSAAGDHLVLFAGEGERIEFVHRAETRAIFARGALKAAAWLAGRAPGRYTMADVLGLAAR